MHRISSSSLSSSFSSSPLFHQPLVDDLSLDAGINHLRSFAESVAVSDIKSQICKDDISDLGLVVAYLPG